MSKKKFYDLLTKAAKPISKEAEKQLDSDDYSDRQTLRRINQDSKARLHGKSRPKTSSVG